MGLGKSEFEKVFCDNLKNSTSQILRDHGTGMLESIQVYYDKSKKRHGVRATRKIKANAVIGPYAGRYCQHITNQEVSKNARIVHVLDLHGPAFMTHQKSPNYLRVTTGVDAIQH
jgi:hypothetical protein